MELFDHIFAKKEQAASVPQVRLVTIWFGAHLDLISQMRQSVFLTMQGLMTLVYRTILWGNMFPSPFSART